MLKLILIRHGETQGNKLKRYIGKRTDEPLCPEAGNMLAQLAYHISTGTPLWNFDVKKGTVLYLALEDDYHRLQERLCKSYDPLYPDSRNPFSRKKAEYY